MPKYPKYRYNSVLRWSWQKNKTSFDVKSGAEDYIWITLGVFLYMIWGTWVQFPQIYLMLKYPKAGITWPTDNFYARLRSDWMWNVMPKILY